MTPGQRRRKQHLADRFRRGRAHRQAAVAHRLRHRGDRIVGHRADERDDHDPHDQAGGERAFAACGLDAERQAEIADRRRDGQRGEIAVDHGRHAGEDLEDRLQPGAQPRRRILRQIDRAHQAQRDGDDHGDDRADEEGAPEQAGSSRTRPTSRPGRRGSRSAGSIRVPNRNRRGGTSRKKRRLSNISDSRMPSVVRMAISEAANSSDHHPPLDSGAGAELRRAPAQREDSRAPSATSDARRRRRSAE